MTLSKGDIPIESNRNRFIFMTIMMITLNIKQQITLKQDRR